MTEVEKLMKEWNDSQRNKDAWSRAMHEVELAEVITAENFRKIKAELEMLQVKMKKIEGLVEEQKKNMQEDLEHSISYLASAGYVHKMLNQLHAVIEQ